MVWTGRDPAALLRSYETLFPPQWVNRHSAKSLWIEAYRIQHFPGPDTPDPPRCVDLGDVCATFVRTVLHYRSVRAPVIDLATLETSRQCTGHPPQMQIPGFMEEWVPQADDQAFAMEESDADKLRPDAGILLLYNMQVVNHRTNLGTFVVLATPHKQEGRAENERTAKQRLRTAAGLLGAVMGRNAVYEPVFDVEIETNGRVVGTISATFENPAAFRAANLSQAGLELLELCSARLSSLAAATQQRIQLSLRLLSQAMHETDGVFAFLKYWIAIETLAMTDGAKIKPVVQALAAIYRKTEQEARSHFAVGPLFRLRGGIVHRGITPRIDQHLLAYMEGVYVDLLAYALGGKSELAEDALRRSGRTAIEVVRMANVNVGDASFESASLPKRERRFGRWRQQSAEERDEALDRDSRGYGVGVVEAGRSPDSETGDAWEVTE